MNNNFTINKSRLLNFLYLSGREISISELSAWINNYSDGKFSISSSSDLPFISNESFISKAH